MSFSTLGLAPEYLRSVADEGYTEPTPVQRQAIPIVLEGRDLLAGAQTGTGKTAAFVLPMLQRLEAGRVPDRAEPGGRPVRRPVRALVLAPTRELALQVEESVRTYGARRPIRSVAIYGGVGFDPQVRAIRAGAEIVVATPGRLLDHVRQGTIDLSRIEILVLDEADRMLDMGFIRDIRRILEILPARRQNLLFSATFSQEIRGLAGGLLHDPAMVDVAPRNTAAELVEQLVIPVDRERKRELLSHLVASGRIYQALVFTRTKHGANRLAQQLGRDGISAAAIHGNRSQAQRIRALEDFKRNRIAILVATDIAARGIDVDALPHVVNFELPMVAEDYVHRIGRTGRAGVGGHAISLVCVDERALLRQIEALLRHPIRTEAVDGFEPDQAIRPEPIRLRSGMADGRGGGGGRSAGGPRAGVPRAGAPRRRFEGDRPNPGGGRPISSGGRPTPIGNRPASGPARANPASGRPQPGGGRPGGGRPGGNAGQPGARPVGRGGPATGQGGQRSFVMLPGERMARPQAHGPARGRTEAGPTSGSPSRVDPGAAARTMRRTRPARSPEQHEVRMTNHSPDRARPTEAAPDPGHDPRSGQDRHRRRGR
jgi:ATP-dependent RNA helicase RhlE